MSVLGFHEDTNAGAAAIADDGTPLAAVAEGRLTRVKYAAGHPKQALAWVSERAPDARWVAANPLHPLPRLLGDRMPSGERDFRAPLQTLHVAWHEALFRSGQLRAAVGNTSRRLLGEALDRSLEWAGHHASHAASAYFTCPWDDAAVVTVDNLGDGRCASVHHGRGDRLIPLYDVGAWASPGQFYGEVASFLGIDPMTAGKVTGLAARGEAGAAAAVLRARLRCSDDGRRFRGPALGERRRRAAAWAALAGMPKEDVAAGAQRVLEEAVVPFVQAAARATGSRRVALAGGVFANVSLNRRIAELPGIEGVWVHPAMSDQGIAMGAALLARSRTGGLLPKPMTTVFLGPSYDDAACAAALGRADLAAEQPSDLAAQVARMLDEGAVVARFDGPLEYGPRALGNRSILARPDDASLNDTLNARLDRSEYMPFAPITLDPLLFDGDPAADPCLPFMTISVPVKESARASHAGVVHVDGTARPQVLAERDNPGMHAILTAFRERTGIPSLVNTSFNRHGEPIVCSPDDAIATFRAAGLDALILGPFLVRA